MVLVGTGKQACEPGQGGDTARGRHVTRATQGRWGISIGTPSNHLDSKKFLAFVVQG